MRSPDVYCVFGRDGALLGDEGGATGRASVAVSVWGWVSWQARVVCSGACVFVYWGTAGRECL